MTEKSINGRKLPYTSPLIESYPIEPFTLMSYTGKNIIKDKGNITGDTNQENVTDLGNGDNSGWGGWE